MATLLKIRGLDRGDAVSRASSGRVTANNGFRIPSGTVTTSPAGTKAALTVGSSNAAVTVTATFPGTGGNSIRYAQVVSGNNTAASVAVTYATTTGLPTITLNASTDGSGLSTLTAAQAAALINADVQASEWVTAAAGGTGATVVVAGSAANLTGGTDSGGTQQRQVTVNSKNVAVVDLDDPMTRKMLRRNAGRFVSLGQP